MGEIQAYTVQTQDEDPIRLRAATEKAFEKTHLTPLR